MTGAVNGQEIRMNRLITIWLVLLAVLCAAPKEDRMVRKSAVAGQFYPADPQQLAGKIDRLLGQANPPAPGGRVIGIQVPHAGIDYSGLTAAHAYKLLAGMDSVTVVMLGTSHRADFDRAAVYASGKWETPLGIVEVDEGLAKSIIREDKYFAELPVVHAQEHSLEVQLPFLQRVLKNFRIVPIMLLFPTYEQCEAAGKGIARAVRGKNVLLLASSDLYHGYSYSEAKATDSLTVELMLKLDPRSFYAALVQSYQDQKPLACGGFPIVTLMIAARELGASRAVLLHRTNSSDVLGERGGYCVGYSAVAFVQDAGGSAAESGAETALSREEKKNLLEIARRTIEEYVRYGRIPEFTPVSERLKEMRGVFVTLHKQGELRGCIGYVEPVKPLYLATRDMAISAATEDPRFPPVEPEELKDIDIEITVLSPLQRIYDPAAVIVGRHGLVIRKGFHSGLLLPQVPVEQGWDRKQFLEWTCRKAGLPPDAYQDKNAELYVFTGEVFGEKQYQK